MKDQILAICDNLLAAGNWTKRHSRGCYYYLQSRKTWNCVICRLNPTSLAKKIVGFGEVFNISFGRHGIRLTNAICPMCTETYGLRNEVIDTERIVLVLGMIEEYLLQKVNLSRGIASTLELPGTLPVRKHKNTKFVDPRSGDTWQQNGFHQNGQSELSMVEIDDFYGTGNDTSTSLIYDIPLELPPNSFLPQKLHSEAQVPLLLIDTTDPSVKFFNYGFLDYFQFAPSGLCPSAEDLQEDLRIEDFLLFACTATPERPKLERHLRKWVQFVLYFMHRLRGGCNNPPALCGYPAFFELHTLAAFTPQDCCTEDFKFKMESYLEVLKSHKDSAEREKLHLLDLIRSNLGETCNFERLLDVMIGPGHTIRPESLLLARYFFNFAARISKIFNFDSEGFIRGLDFYNYIHTVLASAKSFEPSTEIPKIAIKKGFSFVVVKK